MSTEKDVKRGEVGRLELFYPRRVEGLSCSAAQIGLTDVRAADDIRIRYDFDRDGWAIFQLRSTDAFHCDTCMNAAEEQESDGLWAEVAFIKAWALEYCAANP